MNIQTIIQEFNKAQGYFPQEALDAAIAQKEAITPVLLDILKDTLKNHESFEYGRNDYIFALYLLSLFREKKAFEYVINIARLPEDQLEDLLGDSVILELSRFMISTFNGNIAAIKALIQDEPANQVCRQEALIALVGLVATRQIERDTVIAYFKELFNSRLVEDIMFADQLIEVAADLYPVELQHDIAQFFAKQEMPEFWIDTKEQVKNALALSKDACLQERLYDASNVYYSPITDVKNELMDMAVFVEGYDPLAADDEDDSCCGSDSCQSEN